MNMICIGDSLTRGTHEEKNICNRICEKYPGIRVINLGISGQATIDMIPRMTDAAPYKPLIAMVWAGVADVLYGADEVYLQTNLQTMYNYFSGLGANVWALTITPYDTNTEYQLSVRDNVNTWIKNSASNIKRVIDACSLIKDPSNPVARMPAFCQEDSPVHINDLGLTLVASYI